MNEGQNSSEKLVKKSSSLTLKEEILYRKFRNDKQMIKATRKSNRKSSLSSDGVPARKEDEEEEDVDTRMKLIKNRKELDQLLHNVPNLLKRKLERSNLLDLKPQASNSTSSLCSNLDQNPENMALSTEDKNSTNNNVNTTLTSGASDRLKLSSTCDDKRTNKASINIARDATRSSLLSAGPRSYLYEVAKPKPPPRLNKKKRSDSKEEQNKPIKSDLGFEDRISVSSNSEIRLEQFHDSNQDENRKTVSEKPRFESSVESDSFPEHAGYLSMSRASSDIKELKQFAPSHNLNKLNRLSNTNSSGYFSRKSGSVSLSLSNSNASSTASSKFSLPSDGELSRQSSTTANGRTMPLIKPRSRLNIETDGCESNVEEDVFPVNKWIDSPEYATIAQKNAVEDDKAEEYIAASPLNTRRVSLKSTYSDRSSKSVVKEPQTTNSISMVERIDRDDERLRSNTLSGNVKMRIPGTRSKKNEASRNSRIFALQLKQLNEGSPVISKKQADSLPTNDGFSEKNDNVFRTSLPPKPFHPNDKPKSKDKVLKENSLRHRPISSEKMYNTFSGATGRHLTGQSTVFNDGINSKENRSVMALKDEVTESNWSLNSQSLETGNEPRQRKHSIKNRLKGAFSFQNLRKAISMERLNEDTKNKSVSHSYLNELDQDISQMSPEGGPTAVNNKGSSSKSSTLKTPSSVSSILNTVRMRKRKSRERRAAKARHTIAVDNQQSSDYDFSNLSLSNATENHNVNGPNRTKPLHRILEMNINEGTLLVEMMKTSSAPFGFYLARRKETRSVYISSMNNNYPNKFYAGLMKLGDEITEINQIKVQDLSLDEIYAIISESETLLLRIKSQAHVV